MDNSNQSNEQFNGEGFVEELRNELQEIDAMEVGDHAQRFEALHQKACLLLFQLLIQNETASFVPCPHLIPLEPEEKLHATHPS